MIYVLYDGPSCIDGFGAAFAFWLKYGDEATYIPISPADRYSFEFPNPLQAEDEVYILDTSFSRELILKWHSMCKVLILIDHHKSAQEILGDLRFCLFDMTKSGCVLAWEFLNDATPNELLLHIQDRDLWNFKLDGTDEITTALFLVPKDFKTWKYYAMRPGATKHLYNEGVALLKHRDHYIKEKVDKASLITNVLGDTVPIVNSTIYHSELGNALCNKFKDSPYSMTFSVSDLPECNYKFSLRTIREDIDVSKIAQSLGKGGGGHRVAAGVTIKNLGGLLSHPSELSF